MSKARYQDARILIVDDEEANVLLLERMLRNTGIEQIRSTRDGREAVRCFAEFGPDLVLLDLLMRPVDGFQVMEQLQPLIPAGCYVPILVLTADMSPQTRQRALSGGAKDFLTKPLDLTEALLRIRNLIETRFLHIQLQDQNTDLEERVRLRTVELLAANSALSAEVKEHERTAEALRRSELRFRSLVETTSDWIWEADRNRVYTYASPRILELLGYEPEQVIGKEVFLLVTPEDARLVAARLESILQSKERTARFERTSRHKDGRLVVLETNAVAILDGKGQVVGFRGIDRDVTEHRQLEAQLRQAQKMEAVGRLAGGVAHDFNNLLTVILGYTQMMLADDRSSDEERELLKTVLMAGEKAGRLSRQLLTFSRKNTANPELLDLNGLIQNLIAMLGRVIGEDVRLYSALGEELPWIRADAGMLEQVIMNLAVNARDAMPRGGELHIDTGRANLDTAYARRTLEARKGEHVVLSVRDTGVGIPPDIMARIFEPFFTTKSPEKGTGLGLATVYGIVKQHDGWVEVESEVGRGTTFKVFLPSVPLAAEPARERKVEGKPVGGSETVLVVEDESTVQTLARLILEQQGYKVLTATSGTEAMQVWKKDSATIDLLLTDVVMPDGMTGRELAEELRGQKPALRIICTSGYGRDTTGMDTEIMKRAKIRFLQKPYRPQTLVRLIRESLDGTD